MRYTYFFYLQCFIEIISLLFLCYLKQVFRCRKEPDVDTRNVFNPKGFLIKNYFQNTYKQFLMFSLHILQSTNHKIRLSFNHLYKPCYKY